jgi:predicted HTH domain antitoxin
MINFILGIIFLGQFINFLHTLRARSETKQLFAAYEQSMEKYREANESLINAYREANDSLKRSGELGSETIKEYKKMLEQSHIAMDAASERLEELTRGF